MPPDEAKLEDAINRGLAAVEGDDPDGAEAALEDAQKVAGENHFRTLHLAGMIEWARGDTERALGYLMQASDLGPDRADIYLDCAEALLVTGEDVAEAEVAVRAALDLPSITDRERDEAYLTLAQIRLECDDAAGALEVLEDISDALREHPAYLSTRAASLMSAGRHADAIATIKIAVAAEPEDPDFHYQLALTCRAAGETAAAREAMEHVRALDAADDDGQELSESDSNDLRGRLEDVLEDLPDPVLKLVANAPIVVQARATAEQVAAGVDARSVIVFQGTAKGAEGAGSEPKLEGVLLMRNPLLDELEDDEEIPAALFYGLMEEIREFFQRDDILYALSDA